MIWLILAGGLVVGLVVLVLAVAPVLRRLRRLSAAARPILARQAEAESLRQALEALQERSEGLQEQLAAAGERALARRESGDEDASARIGGLDARRGRRTPLTRR